MSGGQRGSRIALWEIVIRRSAYTNRCSQAGKGGKDLSSEDLYSHKVDKNVYKIFLESLILRTMRYTSECIVCVGVSPKRKRLMKFTLGILNQ